MSAKILVIDDEEDILTLVSFSLEHRGYKVATAANGEDGLQKARSEKPDVILLDVSMPVMDGHRALFHIRAEPSLRDIPVIMLTAHSDPKDVDLAISQGITDYVVKPFDPLFLLNKIEDALSRSVSR
jgi:two-component system alkaline phosphatase synthesis response regulator PhoP